MPTTSTSRDRTSSTSTRDKILEAAIAIIEVSGESEIRVDQVVEAAGFTKPVLYHHFEDRDGLIVAAQAERYRRSMQYGLEEILVGVRGCTSSEQFLEIFAGWFGAFSATEGERRRQLRIEVLGSAVSRPKLQERVRQANRIQIEQLSEVITIARDRGWLVPDVSAESVSAWWTGLILSRYLAEMDPESVDPRGWDALTTFVLRSMISEQP